MADLRSALEDIRGQVRARPGSLERIHARHRRRERNRRITAGVVAAAVAVGGVVTATQLLQVGGGVVPAPPGIDRTNVTRLAPAWTVQIDGAGSSAAELSGGLLYLASTDGNLYAVDARSGEVVWVGDTPVGAATAPVVAEGSVLVVAAGELVAFDVGCAEGGATCRPRWTATVGGANYASPAVANGVAYVASSPGGLSAFPIACTDPCEPSWTTGHLTGTIAHRPLVVGSVVWDSSSHGLFAYPALCSGTCAPLVENVKPGGAEVASAPVVSGGVVYVGGFDGRVYAYPTSCATAPTCEPLGWSGPAGGGIVAEPVVAQDRLLAVSNDGNVYAFQDVCGMDDSTCPPLWTGTTGGPIGEPPVAEGGLVYVSSTDGTLSIFPLDCVSPCRPLSVLDVGALPTRPVMSAGVLYTLSAEGVVTAYTVGGVAI